MSKHREGHIAQTRTHVSSFSPPHTIYYRTLPFTLRNTKKGHPGNILFLHENVQKQLPEALMLLVNDTSLVCSEFDLANKS